MQRRPHSISVSLAVPHDEAVENAARSRRQLWWLILGLGLLSLLLSSLALIGWLTW